MFALEDEMMQEMENETAGKEIEFDSVAEYNCRSCQDACQRECSGNCGGPQKGYDWP